MTILSQLLLNHQESYFGFSSKWSCLICDRAPDCSFRVIYYVDISVFGALPQHLLDRFSDYTNFHGMPENGEYRFTKLQDTVANSLVFKFLQHVFCFRFSFIYLQLFLSMQVFLLASWTHQLLICFCGFRYLPLDCLEQLWSWLILTSWIFAEMCSCFGSSWLFCFSSISPIIYLFLYMFSSLWSARLKEEKKPDGISCQVLMTNIWISTLKLLGEEKDGSSIWG